MFPVQGRSRSSMLVPPEKLVSSACVCVCVCVCVAANLRLSATVLKLDEVIVVKLRFLNGDSFHALGRGESPHPWHLIFSLETRGSWLSYGENPESLSRRGLIRYRVVTDRITVAHTRLAVPAGTAVERKKVHCRNFFEKKAQPLSFCKVVWRRYFGEVGHFYRTLWPIHPGDCISISIKIGQLLYGL